MADSKKLVPFILSWETDKYTNNKNDRGGATKYGITLATWRRVGYDKNGDGVLNEEDVKLLTKDDFHRVFKQNYWNACKADKIRDQSVANMLVDFAYNSGVSRAVTYLQLTLGITADGIIGNRHCSPSINLMVRGFLRDSKKQEKIILRALPKVHRKTFLTAGCEE